uniref:Reverse transcriptase domain-containing protein n=1 Tax=Ananas comosus var. bracteatus TaxID=296719 RepID=A0A6V7QPI6_ANACO|nr:unnamed protein product [Ananas comosus var. bracteatus]
MGRNWRFQSIDAVGRSGGILMAWRDDAGLVTCIQRSRQALHAIITIDNGPTWVLSSVCSSVKLSEQCKLWKELEKIGGLNLPWLTCGDFNAICSPDDKLGGKPFSFSPKNRAFSEFISTSGIIDLGFEGPAFTWCNNQDIRSRVWVRLDRAFANPDWISLFPGVRVKHLVRAASDHAPLLIMVKGMRSKVGDLFVLKLFGLSMMSVVDIANEFCRFYLSLWMPNTRTDSMPVSWPDLPAISQENAEVLIKPIEDLEIKQALWSMPNGKAPGPDENPSRVADFRPISLCNVCYKIISKILVNRLKPLLPTLIGYEQAAFVAGRDISDNILAAQELAHTMVNNKKDHPMMIVKYDMEKAYDRVRWDSVTTVLSLMRFPIKWVNWIMACISSPTYAFIINGKASDWIQPAGGLRQGDPLSPYLFILIAQVLTSLLNEAQSCGSFTGIPVGDNSYLSHLMYADDILITGAISRRNCRGIEAILHKYECLSGQRVNKDKSALYLPDWLSARMKNMVTRWLNLPKGTMPFKYLGSQISGKELR